MSDVVKELQEAQRLLHHVAHTLQSAFLDGGDIPLFRIDFDDFENDEVHPIYTVADDLIPRVIYCLDGKTRSTTLEDD